jgi:hypothetical protein
MKKFQAPVAVDASHHAEGNLRFATCNKDCSACDKDRSNLRQRSLMQRLAIEI